MQLKEKIPVFFVWLFLLGLCLVIYGNSLRNDFIFDDKLFIVNNDKIRSLSLPDIFRVDPPDNSLIASAPFIKYYRPVLGLSWAIDYFLWRLNPSAFRLENIIIHAFNGLLIYLLLLLLFKDKKLAFLSSVLFCVHPVQVSSVTFICGRASLLEAAFILMSLILFICFCLYQKKAYYIFSFLSFILALLIRESALLLPGFILLCGFSLAISRKRVIIHTAAYFMISLLYIILRILLTPAGGFDLSGVFTWERFFAFVCQLQDYLRKLILPVGFQAGVFEKTNLMGLLISIVSWLIVFSWLVALFKRREKVPVFSLAFYSLGLLPLLVIFNLSQFLGQVLSEHYVYLSSIGYFIFLSYLFLKWDFLPKKLLVLFLSLLIFFYSFLSAANNLDYTDDVTFYNYILRSDKESHFIRLNLGTTLYLKKSYDEALSEANLVLAQHPQSSDAYLLLGNIYARQDRLEEALGYFKKAVALNPHSAFALNNLGLAYQEQGQYKEARESFNRALVIKPEAVWLLRNIVNLLIKQKRYPEAIAFYDKMITLTPRDPPVRIRLGIILAETGRLKEAEEAFKQALRLDASSVEAMRNLGVLYANTSRLDEAVSIWEKALAIEPSSHALKDNLEKARKLKVQVSKGR
ncbi:MAG: tetratricopeptide repeat protein [Candidatus Omnitrophota bacterium]